MKCKNFLCNEYDIKSSHNCFFGDAMNSVENCMLRKSFNRMYRIIMGSSKVTCYAIQNKLVDERKKVVNERFKQ